MSIDWGAGHLVTGLDGAVRLVDVARARCQGEGFVAEFLVDDMHDLPLPDAYVRDHIGTHLRSVAIRPVLERAGNPCRKAQAGSAAPAATGISAGAPIAWKPPSTCRISPVIARA